MIGAQIPPLTGGKWMLAVSVPLMSGWIAATATSKTDVFSGPFPVFLYVLVVGTAVFVWGVTTERITPSKGRLHRFTAVVLEELALAAASFCLFSLLVGN